MRVDSPWAICYFKAVLGSSPRNLAHCTSPNQYNGLKLTTERSDWRSKGLSLAFFIWEGRYRNEEKLRLHGFNNLTKALSFNIYDVCYAKSQREQQDYVHYIDAVQLRAAH